MAKVAISLPDETLQAVEKERKSKGQSRSEFFRLAVEELLRRERERELDEQYVRAYREMPETAEEMAVAESTMHAAFAESPWEEDPDG